MKGLPTFLIAMIAMLLGMFIVMDFNGANADENLGKAINAVAAPKEGSNGRLRWEYLTLEIRDLHRQIRTTQERYERIEQKLADLEADLRCLVDELNPQSIEPVPLEFEPLESRPCDQSIRKGRQIGIASSTVSRALLVSDLTNLQWSESSPSRRIRPLRSHF